MLTHANLICYIIDDDDAMCTTVVARCDGTKSFLTGRIPLQSRQQNNITQLVSFCEN